MGNKTSKPSFGSVHDPESARPGYYKNGKVLKYHTREIILDPNETLDSFKKLNYGYALTNKRVFFRGTPLQKANSNNFKILNIKDVPSLNDPELTKLNAVLGKSGNNIYLKGKLIKV